MQLTRRQRFETRFQASPRLLLQFLEFIKCGELSGAAMPSTRLAVQRPERSFETRITTLSQANLLERLAVLHRSHWGLSSMRGSPDRAREHHAIKGYSSPTRSPPRFIMIESKLSDHVTVDKWLDLPRKFSFLSSRWSRQGPFQVPMNIWSTIL